MLLRRLGLPEARARPRFLAAYTIRRKAEKSSMKGGWLVHVNGEWRDRTHHRVPKARYTRALPSAIAGRDRSGIPREEPQGPVLLLGLNVVSEGTFEDGQKGTHNLAEQTGLTYTSRG